MEPIQQPKKLGQHLKDARAGRSMVEMAQLVEVNKNTWGAYERMDRLPDMDFLERVSIATSYSLWALLTGLMKAELSTGAQEALPIEFDKNVPATTGRELDTDFVMVPRFDIQASAGPGAFSERENVLDYMAFREEWVRRELRVDPSKLVLIRAVGDSMEPAIRSGDLLLVDTGIVQFVDDAIYVVVFDGALMVKRIQRFFDGAVAVRSDNRAYVEQTLSPEEAESVSVAGRVRWIGRLI